MSFLFKLLQQYQFLDSGLPMEEMEDLLDQDFEVSSFSWYGIDYMEAENAEEDSGDSSDSGNSSDESESDGNMDQGKKFF